MEDESSSHEKEREATHKQEDTLTSLALPESNPDKKGVEEEARRAEQWKIRREVATIVALFLAAGAAIYQGIVLSKQADLLVSQLKETKNAEAQTDKLINSNADLASAAKDQAIAEQRSAATAHDAFVAGMRARIASVSLGYDPFQVGQPVRATFTLDNVGHEPAPLDLTFSLKRWPTSEWSRGEANVDNTAYKDQCFTNNNVQGQITAYALSGPGSVYTYTYVIKSNDDSTPENERFLVDDSMIKGDTVVAARGCMVYKTVNEVHHTAFCYYYLATRITNIANLSICPTGNVAD
jgi:hypothetical protein